jgi:hypothetical protein
MRGAQALAENLILQGIRETFRGTCELRALAPLGSAHDCSEFFI